MSNYTNFLRFKYENLTSTTPSFTSSLASDAVRLLQDISVERSANHAVTPADAILNALWELAKPKPYEFIVAIESVGLLTTHASSVVQQPDPLLEQSVESQLEVTSKLETSSSKPLN